MKNILAAAAFAAMAMGSAGVANAGVASANFNGVRSSLPGASVTEIDWHGWGWRHRHHRHCVWRHGYRRCWWN